MTTNENGTIQECCRGGCCGAHTECDCGEHIAVDPCLPVENTKTKVVQHADNVEQACRVCHADNVGTLYEGIQSLEAGDYIRIDGENRIACTLQAGNNISISEEGVISSESGLSQGRFTEITEDGKVNCTLQAGDGISIDEETGTVSCTMRTLEAGDLTEITEDGTINSTLEAGRLMEFDANRLGSKLEAGDLMKMDEQTGKLDCTLQAGSNMSLEGDTMNCTLRAGKNTSISETGNIDCTLQAGNLMEITEDGTMNVTLTAGDGITIDEGTGEISNSLNLQAGRLTEITRQGDATVIASTLQGGYLTQINGNVVESTLQAGEHIDIAGNTINATYKAGNGISIEGDNIKAPNGYGLQYSNNKLSLYVLSGKGIKNKSEGSQNLGGFAYMPELDIEGGQGITIGNNGNTVTISTATPLDRDCLFEQADSVRDNDTSMSDLSVSESTQEDIKILDAAKGMPNEITVDFTQDRTVVTRTLPRDGTVDSEIIQTQDPIGSSQYGSTTAIAESCMFYRSKLNGHASVPEGEYKNNLWTRFEVITDLSEFVPKKLATIMDRCIVASSPFWLHKGVQSGSSSIKYVRDCYEGFFKSRKALNIPEESAMLVYRDYKETTRLNDLLYLYSFAKTSDSHGKYIIRPERRVITFGGDLGAYMMGKSYATLKNKNNLYFYAFFGEIPLFIEETEPGFTVDAFFGSFPGCVLESMYLEEDKLITIMKTSPGISFTDVQMPIPRIRVMFPKNEIIRKVQAALANGEMDEYGNPLTT